MSSKDQWDGNCPKCGEPVINTLLPLVDGRFQMTYNCPDCDIWWDYFTGKSIAVYPAEPCADCGRTDGGCDRTQEPNP